MEQAGINSLFLVEAKDLLFRYNSISEVDSIAADGAFIEIDSCFTNTLTIQEARNKNGKIGYSYNIDLTELNIENINKIRRSIYGFIPIFNTNETGKKIITAPLLFDNSNQDNNTSSSYSLRLTNFVNTNDKLVNFNNILLKWILETGFWNDENYWVDSALWID